eukprot:11287239-Prorocentrum_lima.AAC.1
MTLWDVPYKHMKQILATASKRPLCDIVNLPGCRRVLPRLFCWCVGLSGSWRMPQREMYISEFTR